jgi:hypothetical protein
MTAAIEPSMCPNCGAMRRGAYCEACGQKAAALARLVHVPYAQNTIAVLMVLYAGGYLSGSHSGALTPRRFSARCGEHW